MECRFSRIKWFEHKARSLFIGILTILEDGLYLILGILLLGVALWALVAFFTSLRAEPTMELMASALDRFLLILMILEILHTILLFLRTHKFRHEPFLVVGIIAGIRRILVITAQQSTAYHRSGGEYLLELSITTGVVLILAIALRLSPDTVKSIAQRKR